MSQYFKALNRLQGGDKSQSTKSQPAESQSTESQSTESQFDGSTVDPSPTIDQQLIYADLLDNLRARVKSSQLPCVVIAGITAEDSVAEVISGLGSQAEARGLRLLIGELAVAHGNRYLRSHEVVEGGDEIECSGRPAPVVLKEWLGRVGDGRDLVLIAAPPLHVTVETALLAKAGDGLVLVVHPFNTPRAELRSASIRARTAGCKILGMVMNGSKEALPRWIRQIIGAFTNPS